MGDGMKVLLQEPDAANPHVRFDERDVETERFSPPRRVSTLHLSPFQRPSLFLVQAIKTVRPLVFAEGITAESRSASVSVSLT